MSYLKDKVFYLSAPIECQKDDNWRDPVKRVLAQEFGLNIYDPAVDEKQSQGNALQIARETNDYEKIATIVKGFVRKDLAKVDKSDAIIAYVPYKVASVGVCHEVINANNLRKPVLLVSDIKKSMVPFWYWGFIPHKWMFGEWDHLYDFLREVNDGKHKDDFRWSMIYDML